MPAAPPTLRPGHPGQRTLVVLVGFYLMLQPVSTDLYLASLPGLGRTFGASAATVQLTLSVFVLGFGAMQIVVGPIADRWGRRPVLLGGLALFAAAAIACALAPTIELLIAARFVQAIGCCAVVVGARAIIRDEYDASAGAKVMAQASSILGVGAVAGPILGSALEVRFSHYGAFVAGALIAMTLFAVTLAKLPETNPHPDRHALRPRALAANYARLLKSREFLAYTQAAGMSYAGLFAYISGSSYVLIRVLGVPTADFGYAFSFCVFGYLLGTLACRRLLAHRSLVRTLRVGAMLQLGSGAAMATLAAAGAHHWAAVVGPVAAYFFAHGIVFPCAQAGAVAPFPRTAGAAAGLLGFLMMVLAALVGGWIGASYNGTVYPMVLTMATFSALVFATVFGWISKLPPPAASTELRAP
ncbi:MAG: multidrug effflux MFS transporter [Betaproteobacteria bacterium]